MARRRYRHRCCSCLLLHVLCRLLAARFFSRTGAPTLSSLVSEGLSPFRSISFSAVSCATCVAAVWCEDSNCISHPFCVARLTQDALYCVPIYVCFWILWTVIGGGVFYHEFTGFTAVQVCDSRRDPLLVLTWRQCNSLRFFLCFSGYLFPSWSPSVHLRSCIVIAEGRRAPQGC